MEKKKTSANLLIDASVNEAITRESSTLGTSKSLFVEAVMRVWLGLPLTDALSQYLAKVEALPHRTEKMDTQLEAELSAIDPTQGFDERKKPGPKPRTGQVFANYSSNQGAQEFMRTGDTYNGPDARKPTQP